MNEREAKAWQEHVKTSGLAGSGPGTMTNCKDAFEAGLKAAAQYLHGWNTIVQPWVTDLGLRHQGVLMTAVRGCDDAPKNDPSKNLVRCYRSVVLTAHAGDAKKSKTFIEWVPPEELTERFVTFRKSVDHYPHHYVMHLTHAIEIVGYHHPDGWVRAVWGGFYESLCRGLHVNPETKQQLDERLGAEEDKFVARDCEGWSCDGSPNVAR